MSAVHGKDVRVLVNTLHVSGQVNGYQVSSSRPFADVTNALSVGAQWTPGIAAGKINVKGLLNTAIGLTGAVDTASGTDDGLLVTVAPGGFTTGQDAYFALCDPESMTIDGAVKAATAVSVDARPDAGLDWGAVLHGITAVTADGDGTTVDDAGAGTTGGGAAALHVTALSGFTTATVYVEHSPDDSTWATLATFAAVTGTAWERVTYAGAVDRYVRVRWDVTGTGSMTFVVTAARR